MVQKFNSTIEHALTAIWVSLVIIKELFIYETSLRQNDHWSNLKSAVGICVGHLFSDSMLRNTYLPSFQFYVSFWTQKVLGDLIITIPHRLRHLNTQSLLVSFWICSNGRTSMSVGAGLRVHNHALCSVCLLCVICAVKTWCSRFCLCCHVIHLVWFLCTPCWNFITVDL